MPNRILREGIISSPRVDRLSAMAEIMYRRLMSVADDYGRYYASPRMVRAACWPFHPNPPSEAEIEGLLAECSQPDSRLLAIYQHKNQAFLEILDFRQQTRSKSKFPEHDISPLATCEQPATQLLSTTRARTSPTDDKRIAPPNAREVDLSEEIGAAAERMYARHPKKRDWVLVAPALEAAAAHADLEDIEECHGAWCDSDDWTKQNGRYCPPLARWLSDRAYTQRPEGDARNSPEHLRFLEQWREKWGVEYGEEIPQDVFERGGVNARPREI